MMVNDGVVFLCTDVSRDRPNPATQVYTHSVLVTPLIDSLPFVDPLHKQPVQDVEVMALFGKNPDQTVQYTCIHHDTSSFSFSLNYYYTL